MYNHANYWDRAFIDHASICIYLATCGSSTTWTRLALLIFRLRLTTMAHILHWLCDGLYKHLGRVPGQTLTSQPTCLETGLEKDRPWHHRRDITITIQLRTRRGICSYFRRRCSIIYTSTVQSLAKVFFCAVCLVRDAGWVWRVRSGGCGTLG